jgi:4-amino-4-deoxy-L-arabinose transferase-like glycosyltransferase
MPDSPIQVAKTGWPRARALLLGWAAPVFVMFTLIATRLPHYLLPLWPALALAVGGTLQLREIAAARGINISKGKRLELVALARNLPGGERGCPQLR